MRASITCGLAAVVLGDADLEKTAFICALGGKYVHSKDGCTVSFQKSKAGNAYFSLPYGRPKTP